MIDKVRMNRILDIPDEQFHNGRWSWRKKSYVHLYKGLRIYYVPTSKRLTILGRLISASLMPDFISNLDVLDTGIASLRTTQIHQTVNGERHIEYRLGYVFQDLSSFIRSLNQYLSDLTGQPVDVMQFKVTYLEVCFNVLTGNVGEYIQMFNLVFEKRQLKVYRNYVLSHDISRQSSFYVKGEAQFKNRKKTGYTINFYNKENWLRGMIQKRNLEDNVLLGERNARWRDLMNRGDDLAKNLRKDRKLKSKIGVPLPYTAEDAFKASNDLRLEVQLGYKALFSEYGNDRPLGRFLDIDECRRIVVRQYERFIGPASASFCSYEKAKAIVTEAAETTAISNRVYQNLSKYLRKLTQGLDVKQHGVPMNNKRLADIGIHWCLIPRSLGTDYLESPISLLDRSISQGLQQKDLFSQRIDQTDLEVDLYNSIEVSGD